MPLNAAGWSTEEDEKLIELVQPHGHLYYYLDPSRKNILTRERTWQEIAKELLKPVEECKKRWRGLRDGYTRSKRMGAIHKSKVPIFEKLLFLDTMPLDNSLDIDNSKVIDEQLISNNQLIDEQVKTEQNVITDNQEYYEITLVDGPHQETKMQPQLIKIVPKKIQLDEDNTIDGAPPKKIGRKNAGRKKSIPLPRNIPPIKILPKPILMSGGEPRIIKVEETKPTESSRSQVIDKLIEKVLKENTNEIDVFFRSMAASVKKLPPNLIPKVKMEVCNVIAKYEMLSYDKNVQM